MLVTESSECCLRRVVVLACSAARLIKYQIVHSANAMDDAGFPAIDRAVAVLRRRLTEQGRLTVTVPGSWSAAANSAAPSPDLDAATDEHGQRDGGPLLNGAIHSSVSSAAVPGDHDATHGVSTPTGSPPRTFATSSNGRPRPRRQESAEDGATGSERARRVPHASSARHILPKQRYSLPPAPEGLPGGLSSGNLAAADPFPRGFPFPAGIAARVRAKLVAQAKEAAAARSSRAVRIMWPGDEHDEDDED
jgi:hypothetical protein